MSGLLKLFGGEIPVYVRYCEVDGVVSGRDRRAAELQDSIVRRVTHLHGFVNGT